MDRPHALIDLPTRSAAAQATLPSPRSGVFIAAAVVAALTLWSSGQRPAAAAPPEIRVDAARRADAALRDVYFVDPDRGWAVGDLGVILYTSDGGERWVAQSSGTTCNLRSVYFSTPLRGFAVGGWYESDTAVGRGVILRTHDGGANWSPLETDLPPLRSIRRLASGSLVAIGDWSPLHLGAAFVSDDSGLSWRSLGADRVRRITASTVGPEGLWLADDQGVLFSANRAIESPEAAALLAGPRLLSAAGPHVTAFLADGTLAISRNAGRQWTSLEPGEPQESPSPTATQDPSEPTAVPASLDAPLQPLCAATVESGLSWIAGAPGTHVWRIDVQGHLTKHETGYRGPLYALHFHDQHRGWAVGGFGIIIATRDGGRTWRAQRNTGKQAMVLGVSAEATDLPWPVLASESLELGHRFVVAVKDREAGNNPAAVQEPATQAPAARPSAAGPAAPARSEHSVGFDPLTDAGNALTLQTTTSLGGGELLRWNTQAGRSGSIAAVLASYSPSVLVLGADLSEQERELWLDAAVRGGVARVFAVTTESRAELTIHSSAVLPVAGVITGDLWADAFALLAPHRPVPERLHLRRLWDQSRSDRLAGGISDGLPSGEGRRQVPDGRRRNFQVLQARSGETQLVERLIQNARAADGRPVEQSLRLLVEQTPAENRERLLRMLLHRIRGAKTHGPGDVRLYLATLAEAARRESNSGLQRQAELRLQSIQYSREWEPLVAGATVVRSGPQAGLADKVAAHRSPFEKYDSRVQTVGATAPATVPSAAVPPVAAGEIPAGGERLQADASGGPQPIGAAGERGWTQHPVAISGGPPNSYPLELTMPGIAVFGAAVPGQTAPGPLVTEPAELENGSSQPQPSQLPVAQLPVAQLPEAQLLGARLPDSSTAGPAVVGAALRGRLPNRMEGGGAAGTPTLADADEMVWQMQPAVLLWKGARGPAAMTSWDRAAIGRLGKSPSAGLWSGLVEPMEEQTLRAPAAAQGGRTERPLLDGRVDDACWRDFAAATPSAVGGPPIVRFAYDADFIYFAIRGSFGGSEPAQPVDRRDRDADLGSQARAVLEIDVDRDLLTAYALAVDAQGRTRDTCDGFTHWQPIWYVATGLEGGIRTIEAAVRRQDLVALPPVAGDQWRVRARILEAGEHPQPSALVDPRGWKTLVFE